MGSGEPMAGRPYMPGYGIRPAAEGSGLLSWAWARRQLTDSHEYWVATTRPDGRPHLMPVWGVWLEDALWFSSGLRSRKARNLAEQPNCAIATDNALDPVVLEGRAEIVTGLADIGLFLDALNAKYRTAYRIDFLDPGVNATLRVEPEQAIGLLQQDFTGSPTRWRFR